MEIKIIKTCINNLYSSKLRRLLGICTLSQDRSVIKEDLIFEKFHYAKEDSSDKEIFNLFFKNPSFNLNRH